MKVTIAKGCLFILIVLCFLSSSLVYAKDNTDITEPEKEETSLTIELDMENPSFDELSLDQLLNLKSKIEEEILIRGSINYFDLERGNRGEDVANLQERLKELGFYTGSISGKYDSETQKAMKQFEKTNGLANDGNASPNDQVVLFSEIAIPKAIKEQSSETKGKETETDVQNETVQNDEFSGYVDFDYTEFFRYPEKHFGEKVKLIGRVIQVLGSRTTGFNIRVSLLGDSDVVYVTIKKDPGYNILENDLLTIYGVSLGTFTYEAVFGNDVTIPYVIADELILH